MSVEIQALTARSSVVNPHRTPNGVDPSWMLLATAVLTRRCDLKPLDQDVFVNVVGGLKVDEPAADLAMSMAIASSYCNTSFPADMVMIGEVGLSGELCSVSQTNLRLDEVPPLPDLIRQQVLALNLVKSWALDSAPFY